MLNHNCEQEGCTKYAPYGYGVDLSRNKKGKWYCFEHIPKKAKPKPPVKTEKTNFTEGNNLWYHD